MNRNALAAALVAGLVLLAGCSSGFTGSSDGTTGESALDGGTTAEEIEGETGTVNMYISDEQNAIEDFEHLNVTITRVGMKPAGEETDDGEDADDDSDADDGDINDTETDDSDADGTETTTDTNTTESVETETETPDAQDGSDAEDESDEEDESDTDDAEEDESDDSDEAAADEEDDDSDEWVEYAVDNRTVDLTELKGANATKLSSLNVSNGTYDKVFVYVSEVNGTLKDGTDQRVKLPSGKLQLNSEFTVGDGEELDFVFDITAVKAGNSGKYILKPVISESGTDVEIEDVDERDDDDDERDDDGERGADERDADLDAELNATFDGDVVAGENVTLRVSSDGTPADGASVSVDDERVGTTDANGTYVIQVPDGAEELDVEVTHEDAEAELEVEFGEGDSEDDTEQSNETATSTESQQRLTIG
jgi:hypothetical protein